MLQPSRQIFEPAIAIIPGGSFLMGSDAGAACEKPVHQVSVTAIGLAVRTVTNREYRSFVQQTSHRAPACWLESGFDDPEQPVTSVSWFDANAYCEWLSRATGKIYRLPTEAEWERAARGHLEQRLYTWGDDPPDSQPGYRDLWLRGPEKVGLRPCGAFGLCEMSENVHEWCSDWFDPDYYRSSPSSNPQGPPSGSRRSSRGGSWRHKIKITRVAARSSIPPHFAYADYGFRLALTLPPT